MNQHSSQSGGLAPTGGNEITRLGNTSHLPTGQLSPLSPFSASGEQRLRDIWWRYWRVLWNRRWLILSVFTIVFAGFAIKAYRTPPVYTATGTIAVEAIQQQVLGEFTPTNQTQGIVQLQLDVLQSRLLASRVIDKLRLWEQPEFAIAPGTTDEERERQRSLLINMFLGQLSVDTEQAWNQGVIRLHYRSTNPRLAAQILNTLFEEFISYNRESNTKALEFAQEWLTEQLAQIESKLRKSKEELLKFQQSTELLYTGSNTEANPVLEQFSQVKQQLAEAELARLNAEILYQRALKGGTEALPSSVKGDSLASLEEERKRVEAELAQLGATYKDGAPAIRRLKSRLALLNEQIEKNRLLSQEAILENLRNEFEIADRRWRALRDAVDKQRAEIIEQNRAALQLSLLKREAEVDEKLFQTLSERLRGADLMKSLTPNTNIRIVDRAEIPLAPSGSNSILFFRGGLIALVLAIGLALLLDLLDDSLKTVEDVETMLRLPNLGLIPLVSSGNGRTLLPRKPLGETRPLIVRPTETENPMFAEAYRTLRTAVLLSSATHPPRAIAITSHEAQAGKTTTAINVALAMAQAGKRVLLVDADMRHPSCARSLGINAADGLSTLLASDDKPVTIYHDCGVPRLDLLPAGPIPPNPSELLSSGKLRALLDSFTAKYDQIIIDTPPLGLVSDALMLAAIVDGVIIVVKAEHNSRRALLRIKESLYSVNGKILGVVLNAVDARRHHNGYYGSSYYYYAKRSAGEQVAGDDRAV